VNQGLASSDLRDGERAIVASCWDATGVRDIAYGQSLSAELCRSVLINRRGDFAAYGFRSCRNRLSMPWRTCGRAT